MKKILMLTTIVASMATSAQAKQIGPYIGADYQRTIVNYDSQDVGAGAIIDGDKILADGLNGVNLHGGYRFNDYFAAELGYVQNLEQGKNVAAGAPTGPNTIALTGFKSKIKTQGVVLDALGYLPVSESKEFEIIGTAGISWTKASLDIFGVKDSEHEYGLRLGGGAQYNFTDAVNLRGLVRYQTADFDGIVDNNIVFSLGLNYSF